MAHFPDYHMLPGDNLALYRGNKSAHHLVVSLQAFVIFELLLGVVASIVSKTRQLTKSVASIDGKHSGSNWSLGILAGSTPTSEIFL